MDLHHGSNETTGRPGWPLVYVVVLNWNGAEDTVKCVNSLKRLAYPNFKVLVVDNGSEPSDRERIAQMKERGIEIILNDSNLGFGGGNNVGIREALAKGADYILLLNNDTIVREELLENLVSVAEGDPRVGICGPTIHCMDDQERIYSAGGRLLMPLGQPWAIGHREKDSGQYDAVREVDYISGSCMLISRRTVDAIGLLPEQYFLQWEDIHYCFAARKAGLKVVYVGRGKVLHAVSSTFRRHGLVNEWVERGMRNRVWFMKSFYSWPLLFLSLASILLLLLPALFMYFTVRKLNPSIFALSIKGFISGISSSPGGER